MTSFNQTVTTWQSFYMLVGTAAVTLIGLLFVAVSIHIDELRRRANADQQHFAALTFNCFFYVLVIAILFLVPGLSPFVIGLPLFVLGTLGLLNTILQQRRANRIHRERSRNSMENRFTVPILSLIGLAILSVGLMLDQEPSLYGLVVVVILLLVSGSQNAWVLLMQTDS